MAQSSIITAGIKMTNIRGTNKRLLTDRHKLKRLFASGDMKVVWVGDSIFKQCQEGTGNGLGCATFF